MTEKVNNEKLLSEVKAKFPSLCHNCRNARKPASDENIMNGYVGCSLRVLGKDWSQISEANEIAEGWVDLRSELTLGKGSGIICNLQLLTIGVTKCEEFQEM
jgi:hypothetical protein